MLGTSRILKKGPEYLRKQMELEREGTGRTSAAERLAATKPNYVKSPQVTSSPSDPEPVPGTGSPCGRGSTERSARPGNTPASEQEDNMVKRNSSKKRPDSILLYRQKCDLQRGSPGGNYRRKRTLLKSLRERNNAGAPVSVGKNAESSFESDQAQAKEDENDKDHDNGPVQQRTERVNVARRAIEKGGGGGEGFESERARKGVSRSHSDVSSRYSKNFADFDAFFKYCGLESDVVESLGKENFSSRSDERELSYAKIRSVSVATSDGEISHTSADMDGLQEEEVKETRQQGSSVIERNASRDQMAVQLQKRKSVRENAARPGLITKSGTPTDTNTSSQVLDKSYVRGELINEFPPTTSKKSPQLVKLESSSQLPVPSRL